MLKLSRLHMGLSLGLLTVLNGCQPQAMSTPLVRVVSMSNPITPTAPTSVKNNINNNGRAAIPKTHPQGDLQVIPHATNPSLNQVKLSFRYPQPVINGFATKSLDCGGIQSLRVELKGLGVGINEGEALLANGSDTQTEKLPAQGCTTSATFDNVPSGTARIVTVTAYRNGVNEMAEPSNEMPGTRVKTLLNVPTTTARDIGFHTTPAAAALEQLLESGDPVQQMAATEVDIMQLEQVFKQLSGYNAGTPTSYQNVNFHPLMFNTQNGALGELLLQHYNPQTHGFNYQGYQSVLPGSAATFQGAATAEILVTGLLGNDQAHFSISDPMSQIGVGGENGLSILNVRPVDENLSDGGDLPWQLVATPAPSGNGTQYTVVYPQGQEVYAGVGSIEQLEVEFIPTPPTISSVTGGHEPDDVAVIQGNFFYQGDVGYNVVEINGFEAFVQGAPAANQLAFEIPSDVVAGPAVPLTVAVGSSTSQAFTWAVYPRVDDLTENAAAGATIEIYGAGFSPNTAENTVRFAGTTENAQVVAASNTQLTVQVPANALSGPVVVSTNGMPAAQQLSISVGGSASISGQLN